MRPKCFSFFHRCEDSEFSNALFLFCPFDKSTRLESEPLLSDQTRAANETATALARQAKEDEAVRIESHRSALTRQRVECEADARTRVEAAVEAACEKHGAELRAARAQWATQEAAWTQRLQQQAQQQAHAEQQRELQQQQEQQQTLLQSELNKLRDAHTRLLSQRTIDSESHAVTAAECVRLTAALAVAHEIEQQLRDDAEASQRREREAQQMAEQHTQALGMRSVCENI